MCCASGDRGRARGDGKRASGMRRRVRKRHTQRARVHVNHGVVSEAVLAVLLGCARLLTPREQAAEGLRVVARRRRALRVEPQVAQARVPT